MKVIYVVPNWKKHDIPFTSVSLYIPNSMPMEFQYVQSLLNNNIESEILDANLMQLEFDEIRERIIESHADVMVFSTTLNYILWRCPPVDFAVPVKLMEACKTLSIKTIAIGPHSSVDPKEVYEKLHVDFLINGEPEFALADFLNSEMRNLTIKGLFGEGVNNGMADEIDMTKLPAPSFKDINVADYDIHAWSQNAIKNMRAAGVKGAIMEYSRGCVFHCAYCFRKNFRDRYRKKTLEQIEAEIVELKRQGIGYLYFIDEIFNLDNKEWRRLLEILKREEMLFGCQSRPDTMSYEMIDLMKAAGCVYLEFGVESFSEDVLKAINKSLDKKHLLRIIAYSYQKFGKENVELGMINFYIKDVINILNLKETDRWNAKVLRPYPNSPIGDAIYSRYNIKDNKWEFLLRYIWWSQIENYQNFLKIQHDEALKFLILYGDYKESLKTSNDLIAGYIKDVKNKKASEKAS